jgi:hypothetical protein
MPEIYDVSGKLVHSETEMFSGAGKHFFFFTGKELPTGTYYYQIHFPKGKQVIVSRTMLIVK